MKYCIEPVLGLTQAAGTLQRTRSARRTPFRQGRGPAQSSKLRSAEDGSVSFHHFWLWYRNYKAAAPPANVRQLLDNLVPEIPGQYQDVIRLSALNPLGGINRYVRTRQEMVLLVRADIYCVVQEVVSDSAIVEQCIS